MKNDFDKEDVAPKETVDNNLKDGAVVSKEAMELLEIYLVKAGLDNNESINKSLEKPFKMIISQSKESPNKIQVGVEFADPLDGIISKNEFIIIDINELKSDDLANHIQKLNSNLLTEDSKNNTFNGTNIEYKSDCQSNNVLITNNQSLLHAPNSCKDEEKKENPTDPAH